MAKNRIIVQLVCTETGMKNYTVRVAKSRQYGKLALMKYCPRLRKHTLHKEGK